MTLEQFVDLMFSKKPNETTYETLENKIQGVAETLNK